MEWNLKEYSKEKSLFKSYYCLECKQTKPCYLLSSSKCCGCHFQGEQERAEEYSSYEKVLISKRKGQETKNKQYQLLKNYQGCSQCSSLEVDAYSWYEKNQLVCQPCLAKKEGGSSSPISFSEQEKWYKRFWKINLVEWLTNYGCLPVNADCAREWLKDKEHLKNCQCLELEVKELVELFNNSLQENKDRLEKECKCEASNKPRTPYYDSTNYGYTYCERCEAKISGAGKTGKIKNRNSPSFWGLEAKEKVLCGNCLESKKGEMKPLRRAEFNRYRKLGRL